MISFLLHIAVHNNNPEVLRHYAEFLDGIEGNTEESEALFSEANLMEEMEIRNSNKRNKNTLSRSVLPALKKSKFGPAQTDTKDQFIAEFAPMNETNDNNERKSSMHKNSEQGENSQSDDVSSADEKQTDFSKSQLNLVVSAEDKQKFRPKREFMKRLNVKQDFFGTRMTFFAFPIIAVSICCAILYITLTITNQQHIGGMQLFFM